MFDYEAQYRRLRSTGQAGWAGDGQARNLARAAETHDRLVRSGAVPKAPARVLELGCGNGAGTALLADLGYEVSGIDISETAVAWARDRFADVGLDGRFVTGSVCAMTGFADAAFDLVVDGACLHCLIGDDRWRCLDEVWRVLRPDGIFVVGSMCGVPKSCEAGLQYDPVRKVLIQDGDAYRTMRSLPELVGEVSTAGFAMLSSTIAENPWWDHATVVFRRLPGAHACQTWTLTDVGQPMSAWLELHAKGSR